jgi:hypothetical protein
MSTVGLPRNALARIVVAREELEGGDVAAAAAILYELELDLASGLEEWRRAA